MTLPGPSLAARARARNARTEGITRLIRHVKPLGFRNSANDHRRIREVGYPFDCHLASAQVPDQRRWLPGVGRRVREWQ